MTLFATTFNDKSVKGKNHFNLQSELTTRAIFLLYYTLAICDIVLTIVLVLEACRQWPVINFIFSALFPLTFHILAVSGKIYASNAHLNLY